MLVFLRKDADPAARDRVIALIRGEGIRADFRVVGASGGQAVSSGAQKWLARSLPADQARSPRSLSSIQYQLP